jgi:hypothetical protein
MARAAREFVATTHTLEGAARGYLQFLAQLNDGKREVQPEIRLTPVPVVQEQPAIEAEQAVSVHLEEKPPNVERPDYDPLAMVAQAAAEIGVDEENESVLKYIAGALEGIL